MKTIKILGTGCPNCIKLEDNVKKALEKLSIEAILEKVSDMAQIMTYGVMGMPGLVIDEKVVSSGKMLEIDEIISLLDGGNNDNQKNTSCCCGTNC